jgi:hypothetical protein
MIAAAGSVDFASNSGTGLSVFERSIEVVDDSTVFGFGDFGDVEPFIGGDQPTGVVDLASAGWVKSRAVENQGRARCFDYRANFGVKIVKKGIMVIEAVGHACFRIEMESRVIKSPYIGHKILRHRRPFGFAQDRHRGSQGGPKRYRSTSMLSLVGYGCSRRAF